MASIGTSAVEPLPPVTVTQTKGYDVFLSARKSVREMVVGAFVAIGTVASICLQSDEVRAAILASIPENAGIVAKAALPVLLVSAWKFLENWQKHRHDPPALVTVEPLPEGPK